MIPYTHKNLPEVTNKYRKKLPKQARKNDDAITIIRALLGEGFIKGMIMRVEGWEHIDNTWVVEGNDTRMFKEQEIGVNKGDLVWEQIRRLQDMKNRVYKFERTIEGNIPVMTIWRAY